MTGTRMLLWDFDGTLGHRPGMWSQALLDVLREYDPTCTLTRYDFRPFLHERLPWHQPHIPHVELTTPEQWWDKLEAALADAYIGTGCSPALARQLAPLARQKYLDTSQWFLYEDVLPALTALSALGWKHVILSNHVPELAEIVTALGLAPSIHTIFTSALIGYEKPHPQIFRYVLDALNHPEQIWMIGDNIEADVLGAQAAGIPALLVRKKDERATRAFADLTQAARFLTDLSTSSLSVLAAQKQTGSLFS